MPKKQSLHGICLNKSFKEKFTYIKVFNFNSFHWIGLVLLYFKKWHLSVFLLCFVLKWRQNAHLKIMTRLTEIPRSAKGLAAEAAPELSNRLQGTLSEALLFRKQQKANIFFSKIASVKYKILNNIWLDCWYCNMICIWFVFKPQLLIEWVSRNKKQNNFFRMKAALQYYNSFV